MQWPGEQLILRLWETLAEKGVGGLLRPWQLKREGKAALQLRCAEIVSLAQAERYAEEIRSGEKRLEGLGLEITDATQCSETPDGPKLELPEVIAITTRQLLEDAVRREVNTAMAITHAVSALEDDPQPPPDKKIDDDWIHRWRDFASGTSAEHMQQLWGSVLAGELKSPGTFSMRCLDFLRNLAHDEAKAIERLSQFVIEDFIWVPDSDILKSAGLTFEALLEMQILGIVAGVDSTGIEMTTAVKDGSSKFEKAYLSHGKAIVARHSDPSQKIIITVYQVTSLGQQILRLGRFAPRIEYLSAFGKLLKSKGFSVTIADGTRVNDSQIRVLNEVPI